MTGFRDLHRCCTIGWIRHARSASVPRWSTYNTFDQLDVGCSFLLMRFDAGKGYIDSCKSCLQIHIYSMKLFLLASFGSHQNRPVLYKAIKLSCTAVTEGRGCTPRGLGARLSCEAECHVAGKISRATCFKLGIRSEVCTLTISMLGSRRYTCQGPG